MGRSVRIDRARREARTSSPRRSTRRFAAVVCATLALLPALGVQPSNARSGGLRQLGVLTAPTGGGGGYLIAIDPPNRRLYYLWEDFAGDKAVLTEYDLRPNIPTIARQGAIGARADYAASARSPYVTALDPTRKRLLLLGLSGQDTVVHVIGLQELKTTATWDLTHAYPGFVGEGLIYAPEDDTVYVVGDFWGVYAQSAGSVGLPPPASPLSTVLALDASTGTPKWFRPIPQCQRLLIAFNLGALIARSPHAPQLYVPCTNNSNTGSLGTSAQGQAGVARLTVKPNATQGEALQFNSEFFPIGGVYYNGAGTGIAAFDPTSDRVFVQSLSDRTPGAWVLDGQLSGWAGQIASPDTHDNFLGVNSHNGHYYMGAEAGLLVSDARATPVPQGEVFPIVTDGFILVDPQTDRMFVRVSHAGVPDQYAVYQDDTQTGHPRSPTDYDQLTTSLAEGPDTLSTFAGTVNGFGVRAFLVGGTGGILSSIPSGNGLAEQIAPQVKPADRGLFASWVPQLDLRNVGTQATSQALALDGTSTDDYDQNVQSVAAWPYPASTCLNVGGDAQEDPKSGPAAESDATCHLDGGLAKASASHGAIDLDGIRIAASSYIASVAKDTSNGTVTTVDTVVRGIDLGNDQTGHVVIGRLTAHAQTIAHGHAGTAHVTWIRSMQGVRVTSSAGDEVFSCDTTAQCNIDQAVAAMNDVLGNRIQVSLPKAVQRATDKGAFAGVQENDAQFYNDQAANNEDSRAVPALEIVVFNDGAEKSRLHVQLAAIEASSIYGITPLNSDGGGGGGNNNGSGGVPLPTPLPSVTPPMTGGGGTPTPPPPPVTGPLQALGGVSFIIRTPKDALLFGSFILMFAAAAGAITRRRLLMRLLEGGRS